MSTLISCCMRIGFCRIRFLQGCRYSSQPKQESIQRLGKIVSVAIIGAPNSGKSTLINKVVERKICAASNKVHTTTKLIRAMCYHNETQIIFLDTPGIVTDREQQKYKLPDSMLQACKKSLKCANVVGVVHDVSNRWTKDGLHPDVVNMLNMVEHVPSFLLLNKVDKVKSKKSLLDTIKNLTNGSIAGNPIPGTHKKIMQQRGYSKFSDVFLISALKGDGINDIKDYLTNNAKMANFHYSPEEWSDQTSEVLIEEAVRAKFLDFLSQEIPYGLKPRLEYFEEIAEEDKIICSVSVECPSERLLRLVGGAGGGRLQQIKSHIRNDLIELFKKTVVIDLYLKVKNKPET